MTNNVLEIDAFRRSSQQPRWISTRRSSGGLNFSPINNHEHRKISGSPSILDLPTDLKAASMIYNLFMECNEPNWDSYGAKPISVDAANKALEFTNLTIAEGFSLPDFVPDPLGRIGLVWDIEGSEVIVSPNDKGELIVTVFNPGEKHWGGAFRYEGKIPLEVRDILERSAYVQVAQAR